MPHNLNHMTPKMNPTASRKHRCKTDRDCKKGQYCEIRPGEDYGFCRLGIPNVPDNETCIEAPDPEGWTCTQVLNTFSGLTCDNIACNPWSGWQYDCRCACPDWCHDDLPDNFCLSNGELCNDASCCDTCCWNLGQADCNATATSADCPLTCNWNSADGYCNYGGRRGGKINNNRNNRRNTMRRGGKPMRRTRPVASRGRKMARGGVARGGRPAPRRMARGGRPAPRRMARGGVARGRRFQAGGAVGNVQRPQKARLHMSSGMPVPNNPCGLGYIQDIRGGCIPDQNIT